MHYANGQPAKPGDLVVLRKKPEHSQATELIGTLVCANSKGSTCNGQIHPLAQRHISDIGTTAWFPVPPMPYGTTVTIGELMPITFEEPPEAQ